MAHESRNLVVWHIKQSRVAIVFRTGTLTPIRFRRPDALSPVLGPRQILLHASGRHVGLQQGSATFLASFLWRSRIDQACSNLGGHLLGPKCALTWVLKMKSYQHAESHCRHRQECQHCTCNRNLQPQAQALCIALSITTYLLS